jgi:small subunit ribosomal protein S21
MRVEVRDNDINQALRVLKKKMTKAGIYREMKQRQHYEKPSDERQRRARKAVERHRKWRKQAAMRDGLKP